MQRLRRWLVWLAASLSTLPAAAAITVTQSEFEPYAPIVATSDAPIPEGAQVQAKWTVSAPAQFRPGPAGNAIHVWAPPGKYTARFAGVWIKTTPLEVDGKTVQVLEGFGFLDESQEFTVKGALPPAPEPQANPYPPPVSTWAPAVEPIRKLKLSRTDATALANVYATAKTQIAAGTLKTSAELRAHLVSAGMALAIRGKYVGLAAVVDRVLVDGLGVTVRGLEARDADALGALAWAVWEAGR